MKHNVGFCSSLSSVAEIWLFSSQISIWRASIGLKHDLGSIVFGESDLLYSYLAYLELYKLFVIIHFLWVCVGENSMDTHLILNKDKRCMYHFKFYRLFYRRNLCSS